MSSPSEPQVCMLDNGFAREVRALLFEAYRREPAYGFLFDAQRGGYERRLRVVIREWVRQHFNFKLPAIGLLVDDRLVAVALIVPPQRRLGVADSWGWRLRMMIRAGLRSTRRYLDYQAALSSWLPTEQVHVLPLLGIHPEFQGEHYADRLLQEVHDWCAEDPYTEGVVLNTSNPHAVAFLQRQGYEALGEVTIGPVIEQVFFHSAPTSSRAVPT
ncbi:GNAT family N-acetyltransferase [Pseudomonas cremoricolorata]|uniref:GNAT family acetyltransferase n=1 Tax=Pseudomonas cremoricolorata TaxID=157783 RepID=A0A089YGV1_9PSED|nr:GNAT family N-acetyltransferase [Pseudomonas cremoricolorata]AIR90943.1 GNAT family acetyltransferase [Pseudomonas cremoricolorata]